VNGKYSISRFGDGEFNLIWGNDIGFQKNTPLMQRRLLEILHSDNPQILIGLPAIFGNMDELAKSTSEWWKEYRLANFSRLKSIFNGVRTAVDANITRFTTERTISEAELFIPLFKHIWENKNITIVEGSKSRLGVGNDLFDNTKSLTRIIAPAKGAFDIYDNLLRQCLSIIPKENVVIIALGPTATVLAYDLAVAGYQALDLGHIDIQYEYYLRGIHEKVAIPGKYVNEANTEGQNPDDSIIDERYINSIIADLSRLELQQ